jgi:hypothetical protein
MKTRLFTRISGITLVGVLTLGGVTVLGFGSATDAEGRGQLEGTWLNEVTIVTCPPAPFAVIATLQSMTTYMRDGILLEGGGPPAPPPAVSRSAGHGIWERTGRHTFLQFFRSHSFDNLGRRVRITEVTGHLRFIHGDNPETPDFVEPYYLSGDGTNKITNLNPVDGSVIGVTEGCNKVTSTPFLFRD